MGNSYTETPMKRYNLALPVDLHEALKQIGNENNLTIVELLRRAVKLFLLAMEASESEDKALIIRDKNGEHQLLLL